MYEFARCGFAPKALGTTHASFKTPAKALLFNSGIGIILLLTGRTGELIIISCFGALSLYIISMIAFLRLRAKEPNLTRPFKTPFSPATPILALVIAAVSLVAITVRYVELGLIFYALMLLAFVGFKIFLEKKLTQMHN